MSAGQTEEVRDTSFIVKNFLRCDRCGKTVEAGYDVASLGLGMSAREHGIEGWVATDRVHHLCPECSRPYLAREAEMERELKRLAGIDTIEFDL